MLCILQALTLQLLTIKSLVLTEYTWRNLTFNNTWYRCDLPVRSQPSRQTWTSWTPHRLYCLVGVMNTDYYTGLLFFFFPSCMWSKQWVYEDSLYYVYPGSQKKIVRSPYWYRKPHWHKTAISSSNFFFHEYTHTQISQASTSRTSQKTKVLHTHTPTSHPLFNVKIPPMWWFSRQFCQDYFIWHKEQIYVLTFSTFPHCLWKQEYNSWLLTSH